MRVFFQIEDASPRRPGVFGRAGSHPGDDGSRNKRESGHLRPRFARSIISRAPLHATAHVRTASHSPRQPALVNLSPSQHFCCFLCVTRGDIKPGEDAKERRGWRTRAHRTACRSREGGEGYLRTPLRRYTGALPAKISRAGSPLPIPSAAKFHPRAGSAHGAASRPYTPAPHQTPNRGKSPPQTPNSPMRPERRQKQR